MFLQMILNYKNMSNIEGNAISYNLRERSCYPNIY
jgi:hypothetical protein